MEMSEIPVDVEGAAELTGLSIPGVWKAVRSGRLPSPVYPLPRAPRWFPGELRAALLETRALPAEQAASRAAAKRKAA
jgi:hypothetical protein